MSHAGLRDAFEAFRRGELAAAEARCRRALARGAPEAEARQLLGVVLAGQGRAREALEALEAARGAGAGGLELERSLARAARSAGLADRALAHLERSAALAPDPLEDWLQLAELAIEVDDAARTARALEQLSAHAPEDPRVASLAALAAEQRNDDAAARAHAERALAARPGDFRARFVLARVLEKAGELEAARAALAAAEGTADTPVNRSLLAARLGHLADRAGDHAEAFAHFSRANALLDALPRVRALAGSSVYGPGTVARWRAFLDEERLARWRRTPGEAPADESSPVFLLGFPRSGTTLLDRVLAAHPEVDVLEERDTLGPLLARHLGEPGGLEALDALAPAALAAGRAAYRRARDRQLRDAPRGRIIVDKLPLNLVHLGLIYRYFPDARLLLALRDPRDVCLSCFFQSFGLNEAMAQFLDWERTVRFYDAVMDLGTRCLDALPLARVELRYEDLVEDLPGALAPALELLGIGWDPAMGRFHAGARGARVNTPSYAQVSRPLYRDSLRRWRHYPQAMAAARSRLAPWIRRFAYPESP